MVLSSSWYIPNLYYYIIYIKIHSVIETRKIIFLILPLCVNEKMLDAQMKHIIKTTNKMKTN